MGINDLTIRRWIDNDMLPRPYLDAVQGKTKVYSHGELEVIAAVLAKHKEDYQYLCEKHQHVKHDMHQRMQAYRDQYV